MPGLVENSAVPAPAALSHSASVEAIKGFQIIRQVPHGFFL
jgi:hypothetical protein